jgi:hypothetical protein
MAGEYRHKWNDKTNTTHAPFRLNQTGSKKETGNTGKEVAEIKNPA